MIKIDYDTNLNVVIIEFSGDVDVAQAESAFANLVKIIPERETKFALLADFMKVETMMPAVKFEIEKAMDIFYSRGVKKIVRVLPDPAMVIGFNIMTVQHYPNHPKVVTYSSRTEAEAYLELSYTGEKRDTQMSRPDGSREVAEHETTRPVANQNKGAETASNITASTQFLQAGSERYAYRRFGSGPGLPLLCLQHFLGTLDNWDPAVTDPLAAAREVILFENAGIGRSSGTVPQTVAGMATHALAFLDGLGLERCDVLGFSLGGMVAQQMALERPSIFRRMILVGTAPKGGEDIMHLDKPELAKHLGDPTLRGYQVFQKIFFTATKSSQAAGAAFIERLMRRTTDREPPSGSAVAPAQIEAFREWEQASGERFSELKKIHHPTLVVNGICDEMIPVANSYWLSAHLPNAVLLTYPDSGHGSLFQFHESFTRQAAAFLASESALAPY